MTESEVYTLLNELRTEVGYDIENRLDQLKEEVLDEILRPPTVLVKKLSHYAGPFQPFEPAHPGDVGMDLFATEILTLDPEQRGSVGTGIAVAIPVGYEMQIRSKSGLAARWGLTVVNSPGTVDAGYRGEIRVLLLNTDPTMGVHIEPGMKIAQAVFARVEIPEFSIVDTLPESERGAGGFGSTGLRAHGRF